MPANAASILHRPGTAGAALRTFFRIAEAWRLNEADAMALLGASRSTYFRWKAAPERARLGRDTLERLSYIFGIYKALQILLPRREAADSWLSRDNDAPLFGGRPPLERLRAGQVADLFLTRQYLDAQRGQ